MCSVAAGPVVSNCSPEDGLLLNGKSAGSLEASSTAGADSSNAGNGMTSGGSSEAIVDGVVGDDEP